jgi:hypothetical protein
VPTSVSTAPTALQVSRRGLLASLRFARSATVADGGPFRACIGNRCSPPSPSIGRARLVLPQETCPGPRCCIHEPPAASHLTRHLIRASPSAATSPKSSSRLLTAQLATREKSGRHLPRPLQLGPDHGLLDIEDSRSMGGHERRGRRNSSFRFGRLNAPSRSRRVTTAAKTGSQDAWQPPVPALGFTRKQRSALRLRYRGCLGEWGRGRLSADPGIAHCEQAVAVSPWPAMGSAPLAPAWLSLDPRHSAGLGVGRGAWSRWSPARM